MQPPYKTNRISIPRVVIAVAPTTHGLQCMENAAFSTLNLPDIFSVDVITSGCPKKSSCVSPFSSLATYWHSELTFLQLQTKFPKLTQYALDCGKIDMGLSEFGIQKGTE